MDVKTAQLVGNVKPFVVFGRQCLLEEEEAKAKNDSNDRSSLLRGASLFPASSASTSFSSTSTSTSAAGSSEGVKYFACWTPEGICEGEQEIYFKGKRVVWSVGGVVRQTLRAQQDIVDCNWASFQPPPPPSPSPPSPTTTTMASEDENGIGNGKGMDGNLCLLTAEELTSYCGGEACTISLAAAISKIWRLSKGILLQERDTAKLWFLGSALSELTEVSVSSAPVQQPEGRGEAQAAGAGGGEASSGARVCFTSHFGSHPYVVFFSEERREHEVYRYDYTHEQLPDSVPRLALRRLRVAWSSFQYPEPASWIDLVEDEEGNVKLYLLQSKTNQLIAFSLPPAAQDSPSPPNAAAASDGSSSSDVAGMVSECFSIPAVSATSLAPLNSSKDDWSSPLKPVGLVVLTPASDVMLYFGDWCVCKLDVGSTQYKIRTLVHTLQSKFVAQLEDGTCVCVSVQLEPFFTLTKDAMSALDVALPKELYHEVYGTFLAARKGGASNSHVEEWESFHDAFSELVEARDDLEIPGEEVAEQTQQTDWDCLLRSAYHRNMSSTAQYAGFLSGTVNAAEGLRPEGGGRKGYNMTCSTRKLSQTQSWCILEALHALYEDYRLDVTKWPHLSSLLRLLKDLAKLMGGEAVNYTNRYSSDTVESGSGDINKNLSGEYEANGYPYPADMYRALNCIMNVEEHSQWLPKMIQREDAKYLSWSRRLLRLYWTIKEYTFLSLSEGQAGANKKANRILETLVEDSWSLNDLQRLPFGLALPIQEILMHCRDNPELDWPCSIYMILDRQDLAANCPIGDGTLLNLPYSLGLWPKAEEEEEQKVEYNIKNSSVSASNKSVSVNGINEANDGMSGTDSDSARLRFSHDLRLKEARKILSSSYPRPVQLPKGMDLSHPETNNVQQTKLYEMAMKTMALSVGRGAFCLSTLTPLPTEPFSIPELTLSGILPHQNNALITLDMNNLKSQNMLDWPQFHNGVAAGLQLAKGQSQLTRTWIVYNKAAEPSNDHAGFLMALGLQGHLGCLSITDMYRYLSQEDEMTTIGVLLGVSAANIGNMDTTISKMLFLHIPARHPAHYPELELSSLIQAAALVGVGLLYLGSSHRIMTEVLLEEIVRMPNTDNWRDQEGYALAAGIGLGLVNLGRGLSTTGLSDMELEDKLCYFMNGGTSYKHSHQMKVMTENSSAGNPSGSSAQVMEDNLINLNVTSPAAAYALGLMYLQTNDKTIASRFSNPESNFALDFVRPDFILLRVLFRSLIMWDDVKASTKWVEDQIPLFLRSVVTEDGSVQISGEYESDLYDVDLHTIAQCHLYALTGAALALGVRFAGSANENAKTILMNHILKLLRFKSKSPDIAMVHTSMCNRANKPTLEKCICMIALSLSLVMAGSGDLETFRMLRGLHARDSTKSGRMSYATSMSLSMAIGFLFLGGGQLSFCTSCKSVAAILISLFPHFPSSTMDNRSHLQALRHLYVLGVENRCMDAIDVESWKSVHCPLDIKVRDGSESYSYSCFTPTILPESSKIKSIKVNGRGGEYWERRVAVGTKSKRIYVKKRRRKVGLRSIESMLELMDPNLFLKNNSLAENFVLLKTYLYLHYGGQAKYNVLQLWNLKMCHTFCTKLSLQTGVIHHGFVRAKYAEILLKILIHK